MGEILLSSYNTQESSGVSSPLSGTMLSEGVEIQLHRLFEQLGGDLSDFDETLKPIVIVQGRGYGNMTYYARDMSKIMPTDQASIGVPAEIDLQMSKVPFRRMINLPFRIRSIYGEMVQFHKNQLTLTVDEVRQYYLKIRRMEKISLDDIWPIFDPAFIARCSEVDQKRILAAILVMVLDNILRSQGPSLLGLFTGSSTSTSLIGQRIWDLCRLAEKCGPDVVKMLREGVVDLKAYADLPQAAPLLKELDQFLADYGHRGFEHELDFESDRLTDRPDLVLLAIAGQFRQTETPAERTKGAQELGTQTLQKMNPVSRAIWKGLLGWGQRMIGMREDFKSALSLSQALLGAAARRLSTHFYPAYPDDMMFFYTWHEFLAFGRSKGTQQVPLEIIAQRRAELELNRSLASPPEIIWFNTETRRWRPALKNAMVEVSLAELPQVFNLKGIPASGGRGAVEGIAVVTNDPIEAAQLLLKLNGPAILVTRLTDPAWSSLFLRLTGVVTELGGVISHAAIVARENGLPAVVGVADATRLVRNGQKLRMDGLNGTIDILD